jgi:hypothetical protein
MKKCFILFFISLWNLGQAQNVFQNPSFEQNGQPYCNGWYDRCRNELTFLCNGTVDTLCNRSYRGGTIVADSTAPDGVFCMRVVGGVPLPVSPNGYIEGLEAGGPYKGPCEFKIWAKKDSSAQSATAVIYLTGVTASNYHYMIADSNIALTSDWQEFIFHNDLPNTFTNLELVLMAGSSQTGIINSTIYYDNISLIFNNQVPDTTVLYSNIYPNPFGSQLSIRPIYNAPTRLIIYNCLGQDIVDYTFASPETMDLSFLPQGIYFYEMRGVDDQKMDSGKIIKTDH